MRFGMAMPKTDRICDGSKTVIAFTNLKIELEWQRHSFDDEIRYFGGGMGLGWCNEEELKRKTMHTKK